MSAWFWILLLIVLGVFAAVQPEEVARAPVSTMPQLVRPDGAWEPVSVGDVEGVIVTQEDAATFLQSLGFDLADDAYWQPALADVETAEAALEAEAGELDHMRQYVGFIEDGDRKILINGFCDALGNDWREQPVLVVDGGDCFFETIFNADRGQLEQFRFNGHA